MFMYRIFGLGNFGEEYQDTAHNIGKEILKKFLLKNEYDFGHSRFDKKRSAVR